MHTMLLPLLLLAAPAAPHRAADHVFVVMLDGVRPDTLRLARAPVLKKLAAAGAEYVQAETIYPSQTRVAFVSLPTGSYPDGHGVVGGGSGRDSEWRAIDFGDADPIAAQSLCARATFFEEAAASGLTSLYAAMKGYELVGARGATWTLNGKTLLAGPWWPGRYDPEVGGSATLAAGYKLLLSRLMLDAVLPILREHKPNLAVINLGSADYVAHSFGPSSPYYRETLEYLDVLLGELLRALEEVGIRDRSTLIISSDHGFSDVNPERVVAPIADHDGHRLTALSDRGIEHYATETGGTAMSVYVRDKARVGEAIAALRSQSWLESLYCDVPATGCDRTLAELRVRFPGRSPDLMLDVDDDTALNRARPGQHGSRRTADLRIPLILSGAGIAQGKVLGKANLVDVAPTVLRLLGLQPTKMRMDGRALEEALAR